jgi:hypothetical protein
MSSTKIFIPFLEVSTANRYYQVVVVNANMINPELGGVGWQPILAMPLASRNAMVTLSSHSSSPSTTTP